MANQRKRANPKPPARRRPTRPPRLRKLPSLPSGPRLYQSTKAAPRLGGPGEPPPGFITATNSTTEWMVYWGLAKVLGLPKNPRQPPFIGYPGLWKYQVPFEGGRHTPGGQVVDFIIQASPFNPTPVALRVQTERYHIFTDVAKQVLDRILLARLGKHYRLADLFEQDWVADKTGQAVIVAIKKSLFGGTASNPIRARTAYRIRGR